MIKKCIFFYFFAHLTFIYSIVPLYNTDTITKQRSHRKYSDFFSDTNRQNYLCTTGLKYQQTIVAKGFSSNGLHFTFGLNLARFFSKELLIGVFFDFKPINGFFYRQPRSSSFTDDFNKNFNSTYTSSQDSATAYLLQTRLNEGTMHGGMFGNIGVMLSVFPNRYGGILIALKRGTETHRIGAVYGNKYIKNGEADNLYFDFRTYSFEISFKPYSLFHKDGYISFTTDDYQNPLKAFTISFFYSRINLKDAVINDLKWTSIVNEPFISKYGLTDRFGITLSMSIY